MLKYKEDYTFRIVQFADLHYGEAEDTEWGPTQDKNSTRVMKAILEIEQPDLVMLTGDQLTGNNIIDNATAYWEIMLQPMINAGVPWAFAFGNHDDLASGTGGSRYDLMKFDQTFPLSFSQFGPSDIHGVSNYVLELYSSTGSNLSTLLYVLDSGGSDCEGITGGYGCLYPDQIEWYLNTSKRFKMDTNKTIPAVSFFHIPLQEYMFMWNTVDCYGTNNDSVACQPLDTGAFAAFKEMGDVQTVIVGHNHGNDFCGTYDGIQLCYGRHSGYGGYGNWERGARVIELTENSSSWTLNTWIRFEDGRLQTEGVLHRPGPPPQLQCTT